MLHLAVSPRSSGHSLQLLIAPSQLRNRPVVAGHVHTVNWLFDWRDLQTLPRRTAIYDLAYESRDGRALQYVTCPGDLGKPGPRWHLPWALLLLRFLRLPPL